MIVETEHYCAEDIRTRGEFMKRWVGLVIDACKNKDVDIRKVSSWELKTIETNSLCCPKEEWIELEVD